MKQEQLKPMSLLFILINLFLGLMLLWTTILLITYIIKFFNEAKGLLYVKEFNEYITNIKDNVNSHKWTDTELKIFTDTFNKEYGSNVISMDSSKNILENTKDLANQLKNLFGENQDNSKAISAIIKTSNEQTLNFLSATASDHVQEFIKSATSFAKHVDYATIMKDIKNNEVSNSRVWSYALRGMASWFNDVNKKTFAVILIYLICWGLGILFSIFQKMVRSSKKLKGGVGAIIWAIFTPILGFIFYPFLTFTYLFRNKTKKAL